MTPVETQTVLAEHTTLRLGGPAREFVVAGTTDDLLAAVRAAGEPVLLLGGGSNLAHPGSISLAHRGILFLDEAPEFSSRALEALRQPLESGLVLLARAAAESGQADLFDAAASQCVRALQTASEQDILFSSYTVRARPPVGSGRDVSRCWHWWPARVMSARA